SYLFSLFHHSRSHSRHLHSFPTRRSSDLAIEAMRVGAFDYITKPLDLRHVEAAVGRALEHQQLLQDKRKYENHLEELVRERTARIEHLAFYDAFTDLPNRALLSDRFSQALSAAGRSQRTVGLILIAIDRFKKINETFGYRIGDLLLKQVSARDRKSTRLNSSH